MKIFLLLAFLTVSFCSYPRILQFLRILSPECNYHGYLYKASCFCKPEWQGAKCEFARNAGYSDDTTTLCDDLLARLDFLTNISPETYPGDDYEFSRFKEETVGQGDAAYGAKSYNWIKMHDVTTDWQVFGGAFRAVDIHQGALGNCYLLAAFASLAVHRNGDYIKNVFITQADNDKHVYVTRWMVGGKPRFVAVDDYVPGNDKSPSFSGVTADHDYWAMILEKSWAKIHGNYMATEAGWQPNVWKSMTQCPVFAKYHDLTVDTPVSIFALLQDKFSRAFPVGAATPNAKTNEVSGHAYAVIGVHDLTLLNGTKLQLIKMYNPWNKEVWATNPWADNSTLWTDEIKAQVGWVLGNDGVFHVTPQDYLSNFDSTTWGEVNPDYEISYIDVPIDNVNLNIVKTYTVSLSVSGITAQLPVYIYIDTPSSRIMKGCGSPYQLYSYYATDSLKSTINPTNNGNYVVTLNKDGVYNFTATIINRNTFSKYITITAYHPKNTFNFTSKYSSAQGTDCSALNGCNGNGKCNYLFGNCSCFRGWQGKDCSVQKLIPCPNNCSGNGVCNGNTGICTCNPGTNYPDCTPCVNAQAACLNYPSVYCNSTHVNFNYMKATCQQYCGDMGFSEGFGNCYIARDYVKYPCKYFGDNYSNCAQLTAYCSQANIKTGCQKSCCGR